MVIFHSDVKLPEGTPRSPWTWTAWARASSRCSAAARCRSAPSRRAPRRRAARRSPRPTRRGRGALGFGEAEAWGNGKSPFLMGKSTINSQKSPRNHPEIIVQWNHQGYHQVSFRIEGFAHWNHQWYRENPDFHPSFLEMILPLNIYIYITISAGIPCHVWLLGGCQFSQGQLLKLCFSSTGLSSTICRIKLRLGPSWGCEKPTISMGLIIVGEPQKCHTFFACIISLRHIIYPISFNNFRASILLESIFRGGWVKMTFNPSRRCMDLQHSKLQLNTLRTIKRGNGQFSIHTRFSHHITPSWLVREFSSQPRG